MEHQWKDELIQVFQHNTDDVVLVEGQTGVGKSTGMCALVASRRDVFGSTLFVCPTHVAQKNILSFSGICDEKENNIDNIVQHNIHHNIQNNNHTLDGKMIIKNDKKRCFDVCTPYHAVQRLLDVCRQKVWYQTIIIDETHVSSVEYTTILRLLSSMMSTMRKKCRVVCISATCDDTLMNTLWGKNIMIRRVRVPDACVRFERRIEYHDTVQDTAFVRPYHILTTMSEVINETFLCSTVYGRILVFLATHDQCEKMAKQCRASHRRVFRLHGGMDESCIDETRHEMVTTTQQWICFTTNMCETSITIPHVDLILDSCLHMVVNKNKLILDYYDRSCGIQRAGRTGRTNDGTVVRFLSEEQWGALPYRKEMIHQYEKMVLTFMSRGVDPSIVLPRDDIDKVQSLVREILSCGRGVSMSESGLIRFLKQTQMTTIEHAVMVYRFCRSPRRHSWADVLVFVSLMAVLDVVGHTPCPMVYYPQDRHRILVDSEVKYFLSVTNDPVCTWIQTLFAVFGGDPEKSCPKDNAEMWSLNFKSLRKVRSVAMSLFRFVSGYVFRWEDRHETWDVVLRHVYPYLSMEGSKTTSHSKKTSSSSFFRRPPRRLSMSVIRKIRLCVQRYSKSEPHSYLVDNTMVFVPTVPVSSDMSWDSLFGDHVRLTCVFSSIPNECVLWTLPPHDYRRVMKQEPCVLFWGVALVGFNTVMKQKYRQKYNDVVRQIRDDVSYWPGMCNMLDTQDHFYTQVDAMTSDNNTHTHQ